MERNRRNKKKSLTFEVYCLWIEELLRLTGREKPPVRKIPEKGFVL